MSDQYSKTTKTGWGKRLGKSIGGIFVGLLLFFGAFVLLFWNEARVGGHELAQNAVPIDASAMQQGSGLDGELVAATGKLTTEAQISDGQFLQPGNWLKVRRSVEIYAWIEKSRSETETKIGGSQETKTTYTYEKQWVNSVPNSSDFQVSEGHENPEKSYGNVVNTAPTAQVGVHSVEPNRLRLPAAEELKLTSEMVNLPQDGEIAGAGKYIYIGGFSLSDPVVGDVRISYDVVPSGRDVTVFGELSGERIVPYVTEDKTLYEARTGTMEEGVAGMKQEHTTSLWIWRVVGFLLMWGGLTSMFAPLSVLLDLLPMLGHVSRGTISLVAGLVSLILSLLTIGIAMLFQSAIALIVVAVVGIGAMIWYFVREKNKSVKQPN